MTPDLNPVFEAALEVARARALILADLRGALARGEDALALQLARRLVGLSPDDAPFAAHNLSSPQLAGKERHHEGHCTESD